VKYRQQGLEARSLAQRALSEGERNAYLDIAAGWERLAQATVELENGERAAAERPRRRTDDEQGSS